MFKNQGRFSYLFSFLVSNATDGQEAEPDHPQGCSNANVKSNNVKKHARMIQTHEVLLWIRRCTVACRSTCLPRGGETTTSPWQQAGWACAKAIDCLLVCVRLGFVCHVSFLSSNWAGARDLSRGLEERFTAVFIRRTGY